MKNSFTYMTELYTQNVRTNIKIHAFKRIKAFFKIKVYEANLRGENMDDTDVKNALRCVFLGLDGTKGEQHRVNNMDFLTYQLYLIGGNDALKMRRFVTYKWFKSLHMWIKIQREIEEFHINHNPLQFRNQTAVPKPPRIKSFSAMPLCSFRLKHIKIDDYEFNELAKTKLFRSQNTSDDRWNSILDIAHINRIGKTHKRFHHQIVTDGVSVSLIYVKTKNPVDEEQVIKQISDDFNMNRIIYELGIDPGMKTWNATMRRTVRTNKEVIFLIDTMISF